MMNVGEIFECRNCFYAGLLDVHGRCDNCGSDSVISQEVISLLLMSRNVIGTTRHTLAVMPIGRA